MLKIEYLSINNLSFRVGVLFLPVLWNSIEISPAPTFSALKKYEHSDVKFSYAHLWIQSDLINYHFK